MGIDLNDGYNDLRPHIGHKIACVCYGVDDQDPHNIAIECEDCGVVLIDFNHPDVGKSEEDRKKELEALSEEELDEMVHDAKGSEAADINNAGKEAQIHYLIHGEEKD